jgi:uncharacterized protein (UPF0303 family)
VIRRKFRKGLEKAFKISERILLATNKREKRLQKKGKTPKYGISAITNKFEMGIEGDIGIVTVSGSPTLEIEYVNNNF